MDLQTLQRHLLPVDRAQRVGRLLVLCALTGALAGLGAIFFEYLVDFGKTLLLVDLAGFREAGHLDGVPFRPWVLALLPIAGGLVGGLIVSRFAPEAEGGGTDAVIDAYHQRRGVIRGRVPFIKALTAALTLSTGGSAGREGPIAQIGAGLGSLLARGLGLSARERRVLLVAGMAAGIGAIFRAPLAGALFAAEVLYREMDLEFEVLVPAIIASIVGYSIFTTYNGSAPLFQTPELTFAHGSQLLTYTLLALVVAVGAKAYVLIFDTVADGFRALRVPAFLKPAIGGVAVGSFAFFLPQALGSGYGIVQDIFAGDASLGLLAAVCLGKMVSTAFTVGSGQSGGVFGPAIVIGGALGAAVGILCNTYLPQFSGPVGAFALVGMAGFFAAAANTPISTVIMVSEITGNYRLLAPTMWVCVITFLLVRRSTLYHHQLGQRAHSPVHLQEMMTDVLATLTVQQALKDEEHERVMTIHHETTLPEILHLYSESHHCAFPVVDEDGRLKGVIADDVLRKAVGQDPVGHIAIAYDLMSPRPVLLLDENLLSAIRKIVDSKQEELVVVDGPETRKVVGMLSRRDLIATYDRRIQTDRLSEIEASTSVLEMAGQRVKQLPAMWSKFKGE